MTDVDSPELDRKERRRLASAKWRAKNPGYHAQWKAKNPDRIKLHEAKRKLRPARAERVKAALEAWRRANPERWLEVRRLNEQRRRAAKRGAITEQFSDIEIFDRDDWTCGICGNPIDPHLRYPDSLSVQLDHVMPISKGGDHTRANVQASHKGCNNRKGNRI